MQTQNKKYQLVIAAMKREILEGDLEAGAPFMTDMVAVRRYGDSRITVRRAFGQLVREGCLSRTRGRGTVVRAQPGQGEYLFASVGQSLVRNGIEPSLIMGIEGCLARHESSLIFRDTESSPRSATKYVQRLIRMWGDGVIFIPLLDSPDVNVGIAATLLKARIPCVGLSRAIPGLEDRINTVLPVSLAIRQSTGVHPRMRHAAQTTASTAGSRRENRRERRCLNAASGNQKDSGS